MSADENIGDNQPIPQSANKGDEGPNEKNEPQATQCENSRQRMASSHPGSGTGDAAQDKKRALNPAKPQRGATQLGSWMDDLYYASLDNAELWKLDRHIRLH